MARAKGWAGNTALVRKDHEVEFDLFATTNWQEGPRAHLRINRDDGQVLDLWLDEAEATRLHRSLGRAVESIARMKGKP